MKEEKGEYLYVFYSLDHNSSPNGIIQLPIDGIFTPLITSNLITLKTFTRLAEAFYGVHGKKFAIWQYRLTKTIMGGKHASKADSINVAR